MKSEKEGGARARGCRSEWTTGIWRKGTGRADAVGLKVTIIGRSICSHLTGQHWIEVGPSNTVR